MSPDALIETEAMTALAELAAQVPVDHAVVEIGTYQGANLASMARAARDGHGANCYGIDPYGTGNIYRGRPHMRERYTTADYRTALRHLHATGVSHKTTILITTSTKAALQWSGPPIGLLVIDGEHRYGPVLADYRAWTPHLTPGATIAFDDYGGSVGTQVKQAVDHLIDTGELTLDRIVGSRLALCRQA